MKNGYAGRLTWIVFLGLFFLLAGGCGYKNNPVPPQSVVPEPISDLLYKTDEKGVQLSWSYPVKTIRGSVLDDISAFDLYLAEIPLEDYCSTCPIPFGAPLAIAGGPPYDGEVRRKAGYETSLLRPGYKYFFKVRSRTSWWADSADSNIVTFVWFQPAAAPEGVMATPGDSLVSLKWQPVTLFKDGSAIDMAMKYQVLRSVDGKTFEKLGEPVAATEYVDRQVSNGLKYFYTIQSMMVLKDELVSGGVSKQVTAIPIDLTPPVAPTGVTVVRTGVGTKVFWEKSDATDIGGYRIYRRAMDRDSFELLGKVEPEYTLFVDSKAEENVRYYYAVTAIDRAIPPNESKKSREATTRY
jgi:hypothetical protein